MDNGCPGNNVLEAQGRKHPIGSHPGFWQMGLRALIIPPDDRCADYGVPSGLRAKIQSQYGYDENGQFEVATGKITALDYTIWISCKMSKAEALATLKYTFDLRMQGNRCPLLLGTHSDEYSSSYTVPENADATKIKSTYKDGVLTITIPKDQSKGSSDARNIPID